MLEPTGWVQGPRRVGIVGVGGSGKSEGLDAVAAVAAERGEPCVRIQGRRLETEVAYGALEPVVTRRPEPSPTADFELRSDVLDALKPGTRVLVDDVQWVDQPSLRVLVGVAERCLERDVSVMVAHRPDAHSALAALDDVVSRDHPLIRLEPLTDEQVGQRLSQLLGHAVEDTVAVAVHVRTGGVQLMVDRLIAGWVREGVIEKGRFGSAPTRVPSEVVETVRTRLDQLDPVDRDVLVAMCLDPMLDHDVLAAMIERPTSEMQRSEIALLGGGLLLDRGHPSEVVAQAVQGLITASERRRFHQRLADTLTSRNLTSAQVAGHLVSARMAGPQTADLLIAAGDEILVVDPTTAKRWYTRATEVGASPRQVAARLAEASARTGDGEDALERADGVISRRDTPDRARALTVAAAMLARRGFASRAADLYLSIDEHPELPVELFQLLAVPLLVASGRGEEAQRFGLEADRTLDRPVPFQVEAAALVAKGAVESVWGQPATALAAFVEAAEMVETGTEPLVLPDSPHALGVLVACSAAEFPVADHLLERAREHEVGGPGLVHHHRVLRGWTGVRTSRWAVAQGVLEELSREKLPPGDELFLTAIEAGLARRAGDLSRLGAAWRRAEAVMMRLPASLLLADAIGELAVGAARLGQWERVAPKARELGDVMRALDEPPLWTLPLRWMGQQAAIAIDDTDAVRRRADEITALPRVRARISALLPAATAWVTVLDGTFNPAEVHLAAKGLQEVGLSWEASRLTGQAAIRSSDQAVTRALLEQARELKTVLPAATSSNDAFGSLSEREQEVARFVVDGLTYKEIGAHLFISPKTVEHHVARIRQKVGATTRAEMLAALRESLPA